MKDKADKNDKHFDLCQLYKNMDDNEREALIQIAGKLFEVQSSISCDKSRLKIKSDKTEIV